MSRAILKACRLILLTTLVAAPLGVCAVSYSQLASHELKLMKAERYFTDRAQAEFVTAIGRGDLERAQRLLQEGAAIDAVGSEGMTALHWAIAKQNLAGFLFLLEHGADPNTLTQWRDAKGVEHWASALEFAAIPEDSRYLRALLDSGADPNQVVNSVDQTGIFIALLHRRYQNASLLIERGANVDHRANASITPISDAVDRRAYAAALYLLKVGADPRIKNRWGHNAIDTTKQFGKAGTVIGSEDETAYDEFVVELKRRGIWGD